MVTLRRLIAVAGIAVLASLQPAYACSPTEAALEQAPKRAAADGYFVKARVIRGYDARNKIPEALEIEKVFVGEDVPRVVTLYRENWFYETRAQGVGDTCSVEFSRAEPKPRLYILYRASSGKSDVFTVDPLFSVSVYGRGMEIVLAEARRNGRLRGRPLPEDF